MRARTVITGVGIVAASGVGKDAYWKTVLDGESRIGAISRFDPGRYTTPLAGEVRGFDVSDHVERRLAAQTDRWSWFAFAAAQEALQDAALDPATCDPYTGSVILASSSGGNEFGQRELQRLWSQPSRTVSAYQSIAWFYAASVGQISIRHQLKGPSCVLAAESAGGLDSLAHAARTVTRGTKFVLAGGAEAPLSPYALVCQQRSGWLSASADPRRAYLPFDVNAAGYVPGEGGAIFVVEDLAHALERGCPYVYGEIVGWGSSHDGEHTSPRGGGSAAQYARAMRLALDRGHLSPTEIDVVFPDALAVPGYDVAEAAALREVFGSDVAVTTHKPLIGRLYQGGSALDVATGLLAMRHDLIPAAAGPAEPAPGCELAFVTDSKPGPVDAVMVNSRGFDGFNSSVVIRRYAPNPGMPRPPAGRLSGARA
ncbi:MAG TPA: beta-ketoacyl synthase N-terminal-like domain-containing protein [Streptosporangiaceae bacterium]|nr:beta-ketoacyl synthase N-terminal-like domain-containing protein [Streptosporangiaceae bacterium]